MELKDKIWKGEYVEIFSSLPLEKVNLDRVKLDESIKEEQEKHRYRLIPQTITNWLQAFAILASVIGEKALKNCSVIWLFGCYRRGISGIRRYGLVAV